MQHPPSHSGQRARSEKDRPLRVSDLERVRDILPRVLAELERRQKEHREEHEGTRGRGV